MAASFKFFKIGEANSEIDRLTAENATLQGRITALEANPGEVVANVEKTLAEKDAEIAKHRADVDRLSKENEAHAAKLKETAAKIEGIDAEIDKRASAKALVITAAQGQPPLKGSGSQNPAANKTAIDPKLTGLEKAYAAHSAQTANDPQYKR